MTTSPVEPPPKGDTPERLSTVCVGAEPSDRHWLAFELYRHEHDMCWTGMTPTAAMMNQVVDWWNGRPADV